MVNDCDSMGMGFRRLLHSLDGAGQDFTGSKRLQKIDEIVLRLIGIGFNRTYVINGHDILFRSDSSLSFGRLFVFDSVRTRKNGFCIRLTFLCCLLFASACFRRFFLVRLSFILGQSLS